MAAQNPTTPGRDADPEATVRDLIAALRTPGAVNAGFAEALIALLETTLEHESRQERAERERGADDE